MKQSSPWLLDESPILIRPKVAATIGLNEAIVIQQIEYWLKQYVNDDRHNRDGRTWVYNTYEQWKDNFPFWSKNTVQRTIQSLEDKGLLLTGNYNAKPSDRTKWYTIDYECLESLMQNSFAITPNWGDHNTKLGSGYTIKGDETLATAGPLGFRETSETTTETTTDRGAPPLLEGGASDTVEQEQSTVIHLNLQRFDEV